ncbi:cellulose biosynthesis protein BcsE [Photobacterium frigidiphilum]|uniref:cellulose biosynthesis protein BcsE n=1 Tax=Photobacterium frigidiphilum TaxID=264736 RepID=UPI003D11E892
MSGILNLDLDAASFDCTCQYINLFNTKKSSFKYINRLIVDVKLVSLVSLSNIDDYFSGFDANERQESYNNINVNCQKKFFLGSKFTNKTINLKKIVNDLIKMQFRTDSILIISIPDKIFDQCNNNDVTYFFRKTKIWAIDQKIAINFIINGATVTSVIKPQLALLNRYISGLATLQHVDDTHSNYHVIFWGSHHGVISNVEFNLNTNDRNQYYVSSRENDSNYHSGLKFTDDERIYAPMTAIGDGIQVPGKVIISNTNTDLFNILETIHIQASTVILSCYDTHEVKQLALDSFHLRRKAGSAVKIIVREMAQCLRYSDEKFLMKAGINLITPYNMSYAKFLSLIEAIQGQIFTRQIPDSIESLLKFDREYGYKGYLSNKNFVSYCSKLIEVSEQTQLHFSLIKLNLLPGMSAEECLRLCHIRRDGDIATACEHAIYVLFSAVRMNDAQIALNNIFDIPVSDLFHSHIIIEDNYDFELELKNIIKHAVDIPSDITITSAEHHLSYLNKEHIIPEPAITQFAINKPLKVRCK